MFSRPEFGCLFPGGSLECYIGYCFGLRCGAVFGLWVICDLLLVGLVGLVGVVID